MGKNGSGEEKEFLMWDAIFSIEEGRRKLGEEMPVEIGRASCRERV